MSLDSTLPVRGTRMPVRTLRVDVASGPDAGRSLRAEGETLRIGTADGNDLVLTDPTVSRYHLELTPAEEGIAVVDRWSSNGTFVEGVRLAEGVVPAGTVLRLGATTLRIGEGEPTAVELHGQEILGGLRGRSPEMRRMMARLEKAARSEVPVLVIGESGTGKELCARALHDVSARAAAPFEIVDCGTLSPQLVLSDLFGHERGAFTGADKQRIGAFERARGGTLFLDEIGELPLDLQTSLLGVVERRRIRRVGGHTDIPVDVRIVSATNRDLRAEVNAGKFRLDLYHRLAVVVIEVPPLRQHAEDVPLLVEHFLRECGHVGGAAAVFSPEQLEMLLRHRWPGNVRELRHVVEHMLAMGETPAMHDGPQAPGAAGDPIGGVLELPYRTARESLLSAFERRYLESRLERAKGNVSQAARDAQMDRSHLIDLLAKHRLR